MSDAIDLRAARRKLQEIFDTVFLLRNDFEPLPIVDASATLHPRTDVISGLNAFRDSVKHDICSIDKHLARDTSHSGTHRDVLPPPVNALYLIAVWNEILRASPPVLAVGKMFPLQQSTHSPTRRKVGRNSKNSKSASASKFEEVKVDVVADNGKTWVRVNTIKNSRLLAEFREFDSYCTDSDSNSEDDDNGKTFRTPADISTQVVSENSIYKMGRSLLEAASSQPIVDHATGVTTHPKVVLRLTRLKLSHTTVEDLCQKGMISMSHRQCEEVTQIDFGKEPQLDDVQGQRITSVITELIKMGVMVIQGEYDDNTDLHDARQTTTPQSIVHPRIAPTRCINLDLSVLVALVSDISHSPLPADDEDALTRFIAVQQERERIDERRRVQKELAAARKSLRDESRYGPNGDARSAGNEWKGSGEFRSTDVRPRTTVVDHSRVDGSSHSRALANQAKQERQLSLFDEMVLQLHMITSDDPKANGGTDCKDLGVEFWTTADVRDRFLRIVSIIGGPREKKRAGALFFNNSAVEDLLCTAPIDKVEDARRIFWEETRHGDCPVNVLPVHVFEDPPVHVDAMENASSRHPDSCSFRLAMQLTCTRLLADQPVPHPRSLLDSTLSEMQRVAASSDMERAAVIKSNPKLTAHTVASFLHGASRGWTTLTANRASLKELLKEMSSDGWEPRVTGLRVGKHMFSRREGGEDNSLQDGRHLDATVWVVEPRSLAEGMRHDFQA